MASPVSRRPAGKRRKFWLYCFKALGYTALLTILLVAGLLWYTSSSHFLNQVRQRVVSVLEDATGGKVEIQSLHWNVWHLAVEVKGLTIHGLEAANEKPYAHVDRIYARAKILSFIKARLGLEFLEADRPSIHLIIYPNGTTNQPKPRAKDKEYDPQVKTVFDFETDRIEVHDGMALVNERAMPFELAANAVGVVVDYLPADQHYAGELNCSDITAKRDDTATVQSRLKLKVEAAKDQVDLKELDFESGKSKLTASGTLTHFADPHWNGSAKGSVDLPELSAVGLVDGFRTGTTNLSVTGQGTGGGLFTVDGQAKLDHVIYTIPYVFIDGVDATTHLHITHDEIALPDFVGRPRQGGVVTADVRFRNYLGSATPEKEPAAAKTENRKAEPRDGRQSHPAPPAIPVMAIRAHVRGILLSTVMHSVVERGYQDLGFDTLGEGPVNVDWTGDAADLTVGANLTMTAPQKLPRGELPLTGLVDAKYFQHGGRVEIKQVDAHSPASNLHVSGLLGVYPINEPSNLAVHLTNHDLGEFDQVLRTLRLGINGKPGIGGLPVQLQGDAAFDGSGSGSLIDPAFAGHITAGHFSTTLTLPAPPAKTSVAATNAPPSAPITTNVAWDNLDATGSYSSSLIAIEQATLRRGKATIHAAGQLQAHRVSRRRAVFDDAATISANAQIQNASLTDLASIAGRSLPVTGTLNLDATAGGALGDLTGGADVSVIGGAIAGQPYRSLVAKVSLAGQEINLDKLTLLQDGGTVVANGSYNLGSKTFLGNLDGSGFELSHFPQAKDARLAIAGAMKFDAHASGTFEEPSILFGLHLKNLSVGGQPAGALEAVAHTQGHTAFFSAQSSQAFAQLRLTGQTELHDQFQTQAKMVLTGLNIAPFLRAYQVQSVSGNSSIGGTIVVAGPLRDLKLFQGEAAIDQFSANVQGVPLESSGPLRFSLHEGVLHLEQVHITGPDTNLEVIGTASLVDDQPLALTGDGALNMKLAQTFDPDITSSGHVDFNLDANGTLKAPVLSGRLHLANVGLALNDLPNGISNLTGNLIFDQNRLEVQDLVGTTGGGQLKFGGFLTYQQGIYGDFTAQGKDIRVRYAGISATADTFLHLQGSQANMLLSGSVQITRFIIGPHIDLAGFNTGAGASGPPNPNAASGHVRLDVHVFSAPQLDFQNSYAQLAGSVDLRVRGTIAQPALLGRINITDGTANFAGATYRLQRGQIFFTNPVMIEPIIDIDATTRVEEYDVTVGLHGTTSQLTPTFRSEPPLPQADVISLLALGRTQEEQALYSQQEQNVGTDSTTNALLGGALNAAVGSRVQKLFGVGSVKIDPTYVGSIGNSSARITVQQNISRNVQVTYATNVNATAQQLIQAQVDVTSSVSLLAVRDEAGVFSLVVKVHKRLR